MTLKELLINCGIEKDDMNKEILFSGDEELNFLQRGGEIAHLGDTGKLVIYPLSGTEVEI